MVTDAMIEQNQDQAEADFERIDADLDRDLEERAEDEWLEYFN